MPCSRAVSRTYSRIDVAVGDRLVGRPRPEPVAERVHVGVRADARVAEQVPGPAEVVARLEDRVAPPGLRVLQVPGGADAGEAGADDQDVDVLRRRRLAIASRGGSVDGHDGAFCQPAW